MIVGDSAPSLLALPGRASVQQFKVLDARKGNVSAKWSSQMTYKAVLAGGACGVKHQLWTSKSRTRSQHRPQPEGRLHVFRDSR
jgi:hypothetical protein